MLPLILNRDDELSALILVITGLISTNGWIYFNFKYTQKSIPFYKNIFLPLLYISTTNIEKYGYPEKQIEKLNHKKFFF